MTRPCDSRLQEGPPCRSSLQVGHVVTGGPATGDASGDSGTLGHSPVSVRVSQNHGVITKTATGLGTPFPRRLLPPSPLRKVTLRRRPQVARGCPPNLGAPAQPRRVERGQHVRLRRLLPGQFGEGPFCLIDPPGSWTPVDGAAPSSSLEPPSQRPESGTVRWPRPHLGANPGSHPASLQRLMPASPLREPRR